MKDIQIEGFKKTLDPATVDYLEQKLEHTNRVDLRKITEKAANELKQLENEAAYDYLKIEKETKTLITDIQQSDNILSSLEDLLKNFRENLAVIKGEMTSLQDKSMKMNIGLGNRKALSNEFSEFIESIMLEPKLIEDILKGEINEEYVSNISKLCKKLGNLKRYNGVDNKSVKEIEPELAKLKLKACERIRGYLQNQINALKKPKTNIQIIQQNNLINYRVFLYFLKEFNQDTYLEISQAYSKLLSKVYANNFKAYVDDLAKLLDDRYSQRYVIFAENSTVYKTLPTYSIDSRLDIINDQDDQLIIAHYESKANKRFYLERVFQSLNKLMIATVIQEYAFCQNFFCLTDEESLVFFASIFKQSVNFVIDKIKGWIFNAQDLYGVLLIACNLLEKKESLKQRNFVAMEHYFNQIESLLWPKLGELLDNIIKDMTNSNPRILKQILESVPEDDFYIRAVNLIDGCAKVKPYMNTQSFPLANKLISLINTLITKIEKISAEAIIEKEVMCCYINGMHAIVKRLKTSEGITTEAIYNVETKLTATIQKLANKLLEEYFEKIHKFVSKKAEDSSLRQVEETSKDFYQNWNLKLANLKNEVDFKFKNPEVAGKVLKLVVHMMLETYQEFFDYVKITYPSYTSNLYPVHKLNIDIKTVVNN